MNDCVSRTDLFKEIFMPFWAKWKTQQDSDNDQREWWDQSKKKDKKLTISYARILKRREEGELSHLEQSLD